MSQIRKFQSGGLPLQIYDVTFDKDNFKSAMKSNFKAFVANARLDEELRTKLRQEVDDFVNNDIMGQSPEFKTYLDKLYLYKSAKLYDPRKPSFNGNDYLLKNFILQDYNGNADYFAESWLDKDDEGRKKALYDYLVKASEAQDYDKYDFRSSKYKSLEEFSAAMKLLAEAINDNDISNDDKDLARSLGIDISTWLSPSTKTESSDDNNNKSLVDLTLELWEQERRNAGWTDELINAAKPKLRKLLEQLAKNSFDLEMLAYEDLEFLLYYIDTINNSKDSINNYTYNGAIMSDPEEKHKLVYILDHTTDDNRSVAVDNAINFIQLKIKNKDFDIKAQTYLSYLGNQQSYLHPNIKYIVLDYIQPFCVIVYDRSKGKIIAKPVFDLDLDNCYGINNFRDLAKQEYKQKISLKNGGTIKFLEGGEVQPQYDFPSYYGYNINPDEVLRGESRKREKLDGYLENEENSINDKEFGGTDYARLLAMGTDLAAVAASFLPYGAVPSLVAGITSAIVDTGADFADVVKGDMSLGSALWNTAVNTGTAFLGMFPGGKAASTLRKVQKWAPRIMGALGAMGVAPNILDAFNKVSEGELLERKDWLAIIQGVRLLALGVRDARTSHLQNKFGNVSKLEIPTKKGLDRVILTNKEDINAYRKLKTVEEKNNFLREKGLLKEDDSVTNSLLDYALKGKTRAEKNGLMTPEEAEVMLGRDPYNTSYRYIWELNNWGLKYPVRKLLNESKPVATTQSGIEPVPFASLPQPLRDYNTMLFNNYVRSIRPSQPTVIEPITPELVLPQALYPLTIYRGASRAARLPRSSAPSGRTITTPYIVRYTGNLDNVAIARQNLQYGDVYKQGGKINKYLSGGLFPNFKTLSLDINPYRLETNEFGMPKKKPFSFNLNPFTVNSGFADITRTPDYMLTEKERDRRTVAAMLGQQEAKKVTSEVQPLIDKTVSSINGSSDPNPWDNVTKLEDALENRDSYLDPYRIKGNILRLQSLYNALNNNKEIYDISLRLLANNVSPTRKVAPSSNIAGLQAEKDRTLNQYRSNSTRPLSSSYEYNNASLLEIEDKIAALEAKYDTAIATQELKDNITATTVANENTESADIAANTNRQYQTALENAKLQAEAAWKNADANSINAFLQDLLSQNDNDTYTDYVRRAYAEKYGVDLATSDIRTLLIKDYITRRNSRIQELLNERLENGLPTYTPEQAKERAEAELEYEKIALDQITLRLLKAYWQGLAGVPTDRIPKSVNYNLNGINGSYDTSAFKKGGSLTYSERKALDDNKLLHKKMLQDDKNVYNERKSTYDRNLKKESDANKMFRDTQNATIKEIFYLINKAIGK